MVMSWLWLSSSRLRSCSVPPGCMVTSSIFVFSCPSAFATRLSSTSWSSVLVSWLVSYCPLLLVAVNLASPSFHPLTSVLGAFVFPCSQYSYVVGCSVIFCVSFSPWLYCMLVCSSSYPSAFVVIVWLYVVSGSLYVFVSRLLSSMVALPSAPVVSLPSSCVIVAPCIACPSLSTCSGMVASYVSAVSVMSSLFVPVLVPVVVLSSCPGAFLMTSSYPVSSS